jgi:hypothetical protein
MAEDMRKAALWPVGGRVAWPGEEEVAEDGGRAIAGGRRWKISAA